MADDLESMFEEAFANADDNGGEDWDLPTNAEINMGDDDEDVSVETDSDSDASDDEGDTSSDSDDTDDGATDDSGFDVSTYKDQLVTVKVNGQDVQVPLGEALNGYMRQAAFTQATQKNAEMLKVAEWATQLQQAIQQDPAGTIDYLAKAYGLDVAAPKANDPYENLDPEFAPLVQTVREQQQIIARLQAQQEALNNQQSDAAILRAVQDELFQAKQEFPDLNEEEVLQVAVDRGVTIRDAYLLHQSETIIKSQKEAAAAKAKADKVAAAEAAKRARSGKTLKGSNAPGKASSEEPEFDSFEDMLNWNLEHAR
jgi:hypothetical protein